MKNDLPNRRKRISQHRRMLRRYLRGVDGTRMAAFSIVGVWIFSNIWDTFSKSYNPAEGLHAVGLAAATYLFFRKANGSDW